MFVIQGSLVLILKMVSFFVCVSLGACSVRSEGE